MSDRMMITATVQYAVDVEYATDDEDAWLAGYEKAKGALLQEFEDIGALDGVKFLGADVISEDDWSD